MDQGISVFHKDETSQKQKDAAVKKPKRGPLDTNEQIALIKVCERRGAKYKEITDISNKQFWAGIEAALEREIGRRYSAISCRRRITEFIAQQSIYKDAIKNGQKPPFQLLDPQIRSMLDMWKEMDEFKEQLEKEKALGQLIGHGNDPSQSKRLQRVADWVKSLPDPEPPVAITPPSTDASPTPVKQDEPTALWARYRKIEEDRAMARAAQLRTLNHQDLVSSRQFFNMRHQLSSSIHDPRAVQLLAGMKRPREEDETLLDRSAPRRPRTNPNDQELGIPALKQSPGNSQVLMPSEFPPTQPQNHMDIAFSQFWDSLLPYFKERALRDGFSITKSETIMHELFKEIGTAMTRAFMKLEQNTRPAPANNNTLL
ncbi:hypothetical protein BJX61DRAFT_508392 [Aspergillus egyptiacus]|nr:hypothetical protein BJX61DRAFT_508392 [Aspergillus egyptiacus]